MEEEVKDEIKYRLRNPFYSSWIIGFVIWNWEALLFLVYPSGDWDLHYRMEWILNHVYDPPMKAWLYPIVLPVLTAVVAVAVMPWLINWLDDFRYRAVVDQRNRRTIREGKLLRTQAEISTLRDEVAKWKSDCEESQRKAQELDKQLGQRTAEVNKLNDDWVNSLVQVVGVIGGMDHALIAIHRNSTTHVHADTANLLVSLGLIHPHNGLTYTITTRGREVLMRLEPLNPS